MLTFEQKKDEVTRRANAHSDRYDRTRRLFVFDPSDTNINFSEQNFEILKEISRIFDVEMCKIKICGSSHLGLSLHKGKLFEPGLSDLDLAILDSRIYSRFSELIYSTTRGLNDLRPFSTRGGQDVHNRLSRQMATRQMINLKYMPLCSEIVELEYELTKLSSAYYKIYKNISVAIYLNEYFFCWKQDSLFSGGQYGGTR